MEQTVQKNIGTWQAWVEDKKVRPHLYVEGEIPASNQEPGVRLVKAVPQGGNSKILMLNIVPGVLLDNPDRTIQFTYNEELEDVAQYTSVMITAEGKHIAHITDIGRKS